jgi:hypothetical protein
MKRMLPLLGLAFALALAGCGGDSDHAGRGVVVAVDAATMTFAADPALLAGVEPGQAVEFRVREEAPGRYRVTALSPRR